MNDERHVDWSGLKYYDSLIKKHVNSLIADLQQQTASVEEITSLNNRLEQILVLATTNQANIQELFNENAENEKNIDILFESDKVNSENIRELQTRVEYIATKEELATVEGTVKTILDDVAELEKFVAQDHITLEELRIAFANLDFCSFVTKDELDELLPDVDGFATKEELEKAVEDLATEEEVKGLIEEVATVQELLEEKANIEDIPDVSGFATKTELEEAIASIEHPTVDLTGYATEDYVKAAIDAIPEVDLTGYATETYVKNAIAEAELSGDSSDIDLSGYATKDDLAAVEKKIPSIDGLATEKYVDDKVGEIVVPDVSNFATKGEVSAVEAKVDAIVIPDVPTKVSELENDAGYLTEHQSLADYYNKAQTDAAISAAVESIVIPEVDLEPYATKEFVESGYAAKDEFNRVQQQSANNEVKLFAIDSDLVDINKKLETIPTKVSDLENDAGYLTEHQSLEGYATEEFVVAKILEAELADTDFNAELYYTKTEVDAKIPSVEGLATEQFVTEQIANIPEPDLSDYAKKSDIPSVDGLASESYVDEKVAAIKVPTATSELTNDSGFLTEHQDISHLATKSELEEAINNIEHPTVDLTGYATESWVNDQGFLKEIPTEYVTETELEGKGYLTEHQSLEGYAKLTDIPDVSGFATKEEIPSIEGLASTDYVDQAIANIPETDVSGLATKDELEAAITGLASEDYVDQKISEIEHPTVDLTGYATEDYVDEKVAEIEVPDVSNFVTRETVNTLLATKADDVPFTTQKVVNNAVGEFKVGDSVQGLTIAQILTKMLGLVEYVEPEEPENPDEPTSIVDKIIANGLPMYMFNDSAEFVEIPYVYSSMNDTEYAAEPTNNCFFQNINSSNSVVSSGYQYMSEPNDAWYYMIALPSELTFGENITIEVWDTTTDTWADVTSTLDMSCDIDLLQEALAEADLTVPNAPDGYTLWIDASQNTCSGVTYRFIINE